MVRLFPGPAGIVDHVPVGRLTVEGNRAVPTDGELVRSRSKVIYNGALVVTVVIGGEDRGMVDVQLSSVGLLEAGEDNVIQGLRKSVSEAIKALTSAVYRDDEAVREAVRQTVRRACRQLVDKRPLAHVHIVRI